MLIIYFQIHFFRKRKPTYGSWIWIWPLLVLRVLFFYNETIIEPYTFQSKPLSHQNNFHSEAFTITLARCVSLGPDYTWPLLGLASNRYTNTQGGGVLPQGAWVSQRAPDWASNRLDDVWPWNSLQTDPLMNAEAFTRTKMWLKICSPFKTLFTML